MYNTYLCDQNQQSIFSVFCTGLKKNELVSPAEQITLKNSVLVVKKQHDFVAGNVPNRMRSSKKKKVKDTQKIVYLNSGAPLRRRVTHAVTHLSSDAPVT